MVIRASDAQAELNRRNRGTHTLFRKKQRFLLFRMNLSFVLIPRFSAFLAQTQRSSRDDSLATGCEETTQRSVNRRNQEIGYVPPDSLLVEARY